MDAQEFCKLAMAEFESVRRLAQFLAPQPQDVDDSVQDTFLRAFRSAGSFQHRPEGLGIRPWLYRILNNALKDRLNDTHRRSQLNACLRDQCESQAVNGGSQDGQPLASLSELNWDLVDERLKRAIGELVPVLRTPFLLFVAGLHYREIAQVIDSPIGTVMSRLYRARQLLSTRLAGLAADRGLSRARASPATSDETVAGGSAAL